MLCRDCLLDLSRGPNHGAPLFGGEPHILAFADRAGSPQLFQRPISAAISASVCTGDGVKRMRSVPRGTVG